MEKHNSLPFEVQKSLLERQYKIYCLIHFFRIKYMREMTKEEYRTRDKSKIGEVIISFVDSVAPSLPPAV